MPIALQCTSCRTNIHLAIIDACVAACFIIDMAAPPDGDTTVVLSHATNLQARDSQISPSELIGDGVNYAYSEGSEADSGTATPTDVWDEQGLTLINSHAVTIEVETTGYDLGKGQEVVRGPLSNFRNGWKVKVTPSTSSMHCVSFHDLTYQVTQRKCCKRLPDKTILNSVSGLMLTGLNAIMGPTGSGKTTLLDILADRKDKSGLSGTMLIDGRRKPPNYKCAVGYVVQDDAVMGTLSVRENLHFSAALRLPSRMTHAERKERVERVIDELGLRRCASTKVGTDFLRGVSGGERKRTNIGMELIIEPQVLFLDEPTTGLDAYTAVSVVKLLKNLSRVNNRIVIMAIHQPRYSIFKQCDTLTLLSQGDLVYHGNAQNALSYFETIGFKCEEHENPADFLLDVINLCEKAVKDPEKREPQDEFQAVDLPESYRLSGQYSTIRKTTDPILESLRESEKGKDIAHRLADRHRSSVQYATNFFWQTAIVILRSAVNLIRSPANSVLQLMTLTLFALIIGAIFFQLGTDELGFTNRLGLFFFISVNQSFSALSALDLFIKQRALFIHESASGYYRMSAFFVAKVLVDIVPLRLIPNTVFAVITYFMTGLQLAADKFFIYYLVVNLTGLCASSVAFSLSAGVTVVAVGNLLIAIIFIVSILFGGLLIALDSLPVWISWLKFLSFVRYAIEALSINEMGGLTFRCFADDRCSFLQNSNDTVGGVMMTSTVMATNSCTFDGLDRLSQLGYEVGWLWYDVIALVLFCLLFLTIAYFALLLIKKEK